MSANLPPISTTYSSDQDWRPHDPGLYSWVHGTPAVMLAPWPQQLRWQARDCLARGLNQLAVLLSQVSCELHTENALSELLKAKGDPRLAAAVLRLLRRSTTLIDKDCRRIWGDFTGDYPAGRPELTLAAAPWWDDWKRARDLRNEVAHQGLAVSTEQATSAFDAAERYIDHVLATAAKGPIDAPP